MDRIAKALTLCVSLVLMAAAPPAVAADGRELPQTFGLSAPLAERPLKTKARRTPSHDLGVSLGTVPQVTLPALDTQALLAEDAQMAQLSVTKVLRYGIGRQLRLAGGDGQWYDLAGRGRLWVAEVVASDALGLRLHFDKVRIPPGARIAVYSVSVAEAKAATGGLTEQPGLLEIYEGSREVREFWTATLPGERARVEYHIPARAGAALPRGVPFVVDRLQHIYVDPVAAITPKVGNCHNDVSCFGQWADVSRAVAGIGTIDANAIFCTGQLLNNLAGDFTPYFLTAHHCINTNDRARTVEFFWRFQTPSCGGTPPDLASVPRSKVATLLSTGAPSNFTLLMIEGTLPSPSDLFWSGWSPQNPSNGTASTSIHHPDGTFKRASFGTKTTNPRCGTRTLAHHIRVNWSSGVTEAGSSGAGIFRDDTGQLYGQLNCGPSSCGGANRFDAFGFFGKTFESISGFMNGGSDDDDDASGNDACPGLAVGPGPRDLRIVKLLDSDWYSISVPPGRGLFVSLGFTHAFGDIDLRLFDSCGGQLLASSEGVGDSESVTFFNNNPFPVTWTWNVFLFSDTRSQYNMNVAIL